jgi:hypothetical protein
VGNALHADSPLAARTHQRQLHQHSYLFGYLGFLISGNLYLVAVELVAGLLGFAVPRKFDQMPATNRAGAPR